MKRPIIAGSGLGMLAAIAAASFGASVLTPPPAPMQLPSYPRSMKKRKRVAADRNKKKHKLKGLRP